jgi:hypothetical protein
MEAGRPRPAGYRRNGPSLHLLSRLLLPGTILNPDWRAEEPERAANLIF